MLWVIFWRFWSCKLRKRLKTNSDQKALQLWLCIGSGLFSVFCIVKLILFAAVILDRINFFSRLAALFWDCWGFFCFLAFMLSSTLMTKLSPNSGSAHEDKVRSLLCFVLFTKILIHPPLVIFAHYVHEKDICLIQFFLLLAQLGFVKQSTMISVR